MCIKANGEMVKDGERENFIGKADIFMKELGRKDKYEHYAFKLEYVQKIKK